MTLRGMQGETHRVGFPNAKLLVITALGYPAVLIV
jgi:hypothetical protein